MRTATLAALSALALAGCSQGNRQAPAPAESLKPLPPEQPAPPTETDDACGAGRISALVDSLPTDAVMGRIRGQTRGKPIRIIRPGDAVTMDYRADRLNIELGDDGRIKRFRCG